MRDPVGWNPNDIAGGMMSEGISARIVDPVTGVTILNPNSDPNVYGFDETGTALVAYTDMGLGATIWRGLVAGVDNGDMSGRPPDTALPVEDTNVLPFWRFVPTTSGKITAQWVADSGSGSGGVLRFTIAANGLAGDDAYIERYMPVVASRGRQWSYRLNGEWGNEGSGATVMEAYVKAQYIKADGTTTGTEQTGSATIVTQPGFDTFAVACTPGADGGTVPADAARVRIRVGVRRASEATSSSETVDLYEVWLEHGSTSLIVTDNEDPAGFDPARIYQNNGNLYIQGDATDRVLIDTASAMQVGGLSGVVLLPLVAQLYVVNETAAGIVLGLVGASSQSGDYINVVDATGAELFALGATGGIDSNTTGTNLTLTRYNATAANGPRISLQRSKSGTLGTASAVASGDRLGSIFASGYDGTDGYVAGASITFEVDGTPGDDDMPGRIILSTTVDGAASPSEAVRIDSSQRVGIGVTPSDANAVLELAKGIVFPATAVASSGANCLDDYEEGSFTPALTFATVGNLSVAYTTQAGRYTKVGRLVTWSVVIVTSSFTHTTASGQFRMTGLPFTVGDTSQAGGGMEFGGWTNATFTAISPQAVSGQTYCVFMGIGTAAASAALTHASIPTGGSIVIRTGGSFYI